MSALKSNEDTKEIVFSFSISFYLTGQATTFKDRARGAASSTKWRGSAHYPGSQSWNGNEILTLDERRANHISQKQIKKEIIIIMMRMIRERERGEKCEK